MENPIKNNNYYDVGINSGDVAILGGSFNPIHCGHIAMAEAAHKQLGLDVVLMPNKTTYYKENKVFAPDTDRINLLEIVASEKEYLFYSDMEILRGGITHTIDTIREFLKADESRKVYFIIGGDSLEWLDRWVEADALLKLTYFLTAVRGETDREKTKLIIERIYKEHPESHISILDMDDIPISSSDIRNRIAEGASIEGLVPDKVREYIYTRGLYAKNN